MNYITTYLRKIISRRYYSTIHSHEWIVLFCAVILGRYYTDFHDVDEDLRTIMVQGGDCVAHILVGITHRDLDDPPFSAGSTVASKK